MAGKPQYGEDEITEFIETAQLKGIAPAIRELKYPSYPTAQRWFRERGLEMPSIDSLMAKAAELKVYYSDNEKKYALQVAMDAVVEKIQNNDLDADELNKASNALAKLIQTFQLVEGKSTSVMEKREAGTIDASVQKLVEDMRNKNANKEMELN